MLALKGPAQAGAMPSAPHLWSIRFLTESLGPDDEAPARDPEPEKGVECVNVILPRVWGF